MDKAERKIRGPRASPAQHAALISFLEKENGLAEGKFTALHGKETTKKKWLELADELNQIPGAVKNGYQWQIVWRDLKSKTSTKFKTLKKERVLTGNQPLSKGMLTPLEERIVGIVGWSYMAGNENCPDNIDLNIVDETQISVDSPIQVQIQSDVNESCSAPQASVSSSATINNKRSPESEDFAPKHKKIENSVREDFLQIAKKQADAMLVLANAQQETAKAFSKIADSLSTLSENLLTQKQIEASLLKLEDMTKFYNAALEM